MSSIDKQALIAKIKKQTESFDTVVIREDEANALLDELEAAEKRVAELEASHVKLRESMAAIHNTIRLDGVGTSLSAIMGAAKRAHEESASVAGIRINGEG